MALTYNLTPERGSLPAGIPDSIRVPLGWHEMTDSQLSRLKRAGLLRREAVAIALDIEEGLLDQLPGWFLRALPENIAFITEHFTD